MKWPWGRPAPTPTFPCGSCGTPLDAPADKHRIGDAHLRDGRHVDKWCDGSEE